MTQNAAPGKPAQTALALFDFDGTMIRGDSIVPFLAFALKRGDVSLAGYLKGCLAGALYALHLMDGGRAKQKALAFYQTLSMEKRRALDRAFALERLLPRVYSPARERLKRHQAAGLHTVLLSASTENYMQYVAKALGFHQLLCTPVSDGGVVGKNCHGQEKVERLRQYLKASGLSPDFAASFAYGDSRGDLPMLRLCGHPRLVNAKKALIKAAPEMKKEQWATR